MLDENLDDIIIYTSFQTYFEFSLQSFDFLITRTAIIKLMQAKATM